MRVEELAGKAAVCRFKTGLNDPRRPIGSFLFCGPTKGFEPRYGVSPPQRTIEQQVVSRLSRFLIENRNVRGYRLEIDYRPETNDIRVQHLF